MKLSIGARLFAFGIALASSTNANVCRLSKTSSPSAPSSVSSSSASSSASSSSTIFSSSSSAAPAGPTCTNLAVNGDFSAGATDWNYTPFVSFVSSPACQDKDYCSKVTSSSGIIRLVEQNIATVVGQTYPIRGSYYVSALGTPPSTNIVRIGAFAYVDGIPVPVYQDTPIAAVSTGWQTFSLDYTAIATQTTVYFEAASTKSMTVLFADAVVGSAAGCYTVE